MKSLIPMKNIRCRSIGVCLAAASIGLAGCAESPEFVYLPVVPRVLEPTKDSLLQNGVEITFRWRAVEYTSEYQFHVFDRSTDQLVNRRVGLYPERVCDQDVCSITEVLDLAIMDGHAWRVRAVNPAGPSPWTRTVFRIVR